jgi:microcin C transport system substrate-binding protein
LNARFFQRACGAALLIAIPMMTAAKASASEREWRHGLSLFGDLKYKPDFKHFDYVNPDAPKGGSVRQLAIGTFDNFNLVVAGVKGAMAVGVDLVFDTLTAPALDEVSAAYGLLAESVSYPDDFSSVTYRLRPQARFHDGTPVTPEDVIFSFNAFKQNSPQLSAYYQHVTKAEKNGEREVTFTFDAPGNRELPQIVGEINVLPKHWYEGTDKSGKKRDITATSLEPPLGNGAYRIKEFVPGRSIVYERVKDYWGKDLPVNIGRPSGGPISTSCASNISAIRRWRSRRSRAISSTGAPRTSPRTGQPPTTSRRCSTSVSSKRNFRSAVKASCKGSS